MTHSIFIRPREHGYQFEYWRVSKEDVVEVESVHNFKGPDAKLDMLIHFRECMRGA